VLTIFSDEVVTQAEGFQFAHWEVNRGGSFNGAAFDEEMNENPHRIGAKLADACFGEVARLKGVAQGGEFGAGSQADGKHG
jgi:hypothetical protein